MHMFGFKMTWLFSAWLLIIVHSVIPHHHHQNPASVSRYYHIAGHSPLSHHQRHSDAGNENKHDHSSAFVHPEEFGVFIAASSLELKKISKLQSGMLFLICEAFGFVFETVHKTFADWFSDRPPPYLLLPNGMRGSPYFFYAAA